MHEPLFAARPPYFAGRGVFGRQGGDQPFGIRVVPVQQGPNMFKDLLPRAETQVIKGYRVHQLEVVMIGGFLIRGTGGGRHGNRQLIPEGFRESREERLPVQVFLDLRKSGDQCFYIQWNSPLGDGRL